jgi:hypothetical protein
VIISLLSSCEKGRISKNTRDCVKDKISTFEETSSCEDGVKVDCYIFQDEQVFVFDPGTCGADMTSEVIDSDGNTLGYLGGLMGNQTINGENFSNADFRENVWEK